MLLKFWITNKLAKKLWSITSSNLFGKRQRPWERWRWNWVCAQISVFLCLCRHPSTPIHSHHNPTHTANSLAKSLAKCLLARVNYIRAYVTFSDSDEHSYIHQVHIVPNNYFSRKKYQIINVEVPSTLLFWDCYWLSEPVRRILEAQLNTLNYCSIRCNWCTFLFLRCLWWTLPSTPEL